MKIRFTPTFYRKLEAIASCVYKKSKSHSFTVEYIRKLVHQHYSILYHVEDDYILLITIYKESLLSL